MNLSNICNLFKQSNNGGKRLIMKKGKIFFLIFMIIWLVLIILNFVLPEPAFSEQENRYLAKIPEFSFDGLVSGKYSKELDTYINDHFVFRNFWLKLNSLVQLSIGKTENNGVYIGKDGYLFEKFEYTDKEKANIAIAVNAINKFALNTNIPTYFLLVPNSIYINKDKLPDNVKVPDQNEIISEVYSDCTDVQTINTVETLEENKSTTKLYFKTDHHMTSEGAYLLYKEFCKVTNLIPAELSEFTKETVSIDFLGTFDSKAQVPWQEQDEINVYKNAINTNVLGNYDGELYNSIFNSDYLTKKDKYSYFLNGNHAKVIIKTQVNNGKKLLVIKDSYAHIMAQFLCQNYEEIHFLDPRYYNLALSDYCKKNEIDETLFLYNVSNLVSDIGIRNVR